MVLFYSFVPFKWILNLGYAFLFVRRDVKNTRKTLKDVGLINEYPS